MYAGLVIAAAVLAILYFAKFTVRVTDDGLIEYRFFPFHFKTYRISSQDISEMHVRSYTPMGWGIRYYFFERMTAYILSGTKGSEVQLKTGREILFGTPRAPEMMQYLKLAGGL